MPISRTVHKSEIHITGMITRNAPQTGSTSKLKQKKIHTNNCYNGKIPLLELNIRFGYKWSFHKLYLLPFLAFMYNSGIVGGTGRQANIFSLKYF